MGRLHRLVHVKQNPYVDRSERNLKTSKVSATAQIAHEERKRKPLPLSPLRRASAAAIARQSRLIPGVLPANALFVRRCSAENQIQAIYRGKCAPITMQGLAMAREKPPGREQGRTGKKTGRRTMETVGNPGAC